MNKHLSKTILRIVVAALILALVGVGIWLIFFRPSDNISVFNTLTQLELKEKVDLNNHINGYETKNSKNEVVRVPGIRESRTITKNDVTINLDGALIEVNNNTANATEIKKYNNAIYYRAFIFRGFASVTNPFENTSKAFSATNQDLNFTTLEKVYNAINTCYYNYFSYAQLATGVSNDAVKAMNTKVDSLKKAINSFNSKSDEIIKLQTQIDTVYNPTIVNEIFVAYRDLYTRYFNILANYNNLTIELMNFVNRFVFDSNPVYDVNTVKLEISMNTINEFVKREVVDPIPFINNDEGLTADQTNAYNNFLSFAFDAMKTSKLNITDENLVQNYADLKGYNGQNANTANAITGSQNIFTLNRSQKAQLVKTTPADGDLVVSDLYYTDNGFGEKIISLINAVYA